MAENTALVTSQKDVRTSFYFLSFGFLILPFLVVTCKECPLIVQCDELKKECQDSKMREKRRSNVSLMMLRFADNRTPYRIYSEAAIIVHFSLS